MNKRGISPVIATVSLIFFAAVLLIVVVAFSKTNDAHTDECSADVRLRLAVIGGEDQVCFNEDEKKIEFIIENGPNVEVEGFEVNLITSRKMEIFQFNEIMIGKAGTYIEKIPYNQEEVGKFRQLRITPKVLLCDEEPVAVEEALLVNKISNC